MRSLYPLLGFVLWRLLPKRRTRRTGGRPPSGMPRGQQKGKERRPRTPSSSSSSSSSSFFVDMTSLKLILHLWSIIKNSQSHQKLSLESAFTILNWLRFSITPSANRHDIDMVGKMRSFISHTLSKYQSLSMGKRIQQQGRKRWICLLLRSLPVVRSGTILRSRHFPVTHTRATKTFLSFFPSTPKPRALRYQLKS